MLDKAEQRGVFLSCHLGPSIQLKWWVTALGECYPKRKTFERARASQYDTI